jgi:phage baseplate assembly protein W
VDRLLPHLHSDPEEAALGVTAMGTKQPDRLGQGLSFPPRVGPDGRLAWSAGEDNVRELIRVILMTEAGERLMRESFGGGLRQYLFEPNVPTTHQRIRSSIEQAIARWEPRVSVDDVAVDADSDDPQRVNINVQFRLVATQGAGTVNFTLQLQG